MVILRAAVDNNSKSPNFLFECRVRKAQLAPILRIARCRSGTARSDLEINGLAIEEAVAISISDAANEDGTIE